MAIRIYSLLLCLGLCWAPMLRAEAQATIQGQVTDARTKEPLPFAGVFLANTTYGTTADSIGQYRLGGVAPGQYEMVVSYLGYQLYKKTITVQQSVTMPIALQPAAAQLGEVVVRPKNKPADYQKFTRLFLGNSALSLKCRIENPQEVYVAYDPAARELTAVAPKTLKVLNPVLGYRITYHRLDFKVNYRMGTVTLLGWPVFEELTPANPQQQQHWLEQRRQAYLGSLAHFLRSVRTNQVQSEGFVVRPLITEPDNPQTQLHVQQAGDSLAAVQTLNGLTSRIYQQELAAADIRRLVPDTTHVQLQYKHSLQVTYVAEKPEDTFVAETRMQRQFAQQEMQKRKYMGSNTNAIIRGTTDPVQQVSEIRFLGPVAEIQPNGYLLNPLSIRVDGYWGYERVGESLPLDYTPSLLK
ncbi:carboxypeptidase-like regulatory domain-containing protein [Hymenobacter pini]|uniref:carboxypeptidase-like regulatory domain-containing protein n=1 Tax=Hymenobacter pini TaxID=2880879 RepID=UPI001CF54358|nr:carboxypeptidase-like regulatory domain-containing protein [Hymenobacter pini]MCA8831892.1 carboxypeptidase-like regulatory domain-containing protein [Hymenobacter pini]